MCTSTMHIFMVVNFFCCTFQLQDLVSLLCTLQRLTESYLPERQSLGKTTKLMLMSKTINLSYSLNNATENGSQKLPPFSASICQGCIQGRGHLGIFSLGRVSPPSPIFLATSYKQLKTSQAYLSSK